jgi:hypothetical protein
LHSRSNEKDNGTKHKRGSSTKSIRNVERRHGTEEAASLKNRNYVSREIAESFFLSGCGGLQIKGFLERFHRQYTTDEASVPTKQHSPERSYECKNVGIAVCFDVRPDGIHLGGCSGGHNEVTDEKFGCS